MSSAARRTPSLVRLVLRLSRLAKVAATVAGVGACLAVYGKLRNVDWATLVGSLAFFGAVIVYYAERLRMIRNRRKTQ